MHNLFNYMKVEYDFSSGVVRFDGGEPYNIESLRRYAVNFHPDSLKPYFIKAIRCNKRTIFTFDFDGFFQDIDIPFLRQYKKYLSSCFDNRVMPVSGITQKSEHLDCILASVKRQFIVDVHDTKLLQGSLGRMDGRGTSYPLMVFIGVSDMHGFPHSLIQEEAQVEPERFNTLLTQFAEEIKKGQRVYNKTVLVLNDLRGKFEKYVDLGDLGS